MCKYLRFNFNPLVTGNIHHNEVNTHVTYKLINKFMYLGALLYTWVDVV